MDLIASLQRQVAVAADDPGLTPVERAAKLRALRSRLEDALGETDRRIADAEKVAESQASGRVRDHLFVRSNAGLREQLDGFDEAELDGAGMLTLAELELLREEGLLEGAVGGLRKAWDESLHPRGRGGQFGNKLGVPAAPKVKLPELPEPARPQRSPAPRPDAAPRAPAHMVPAGVAKDGGKLVTSDINEAVRALGEGRKVELNQPREVSTLLRALHKVAVDAEASGEKAPDFDLCNVTVKGTNIFCVENVGIDRVRMPQLKAVPLPGSRADKLKKNKHGEVNLEALFREHLIRKGVKVEKGQEQASYLRASQRELSGVKVAGMMAALEGGTMKRGRSLFISREGYIVDGHHRWAAEVGKDFSDDSPDPPMDVERIDMPILDLLAESNAFAKKWGLPQSSVTDTRPDAKANPEAAAPSSPTASVSFDAHGKDFERDLKRFGKLYGVTVGKRTRVTVDGEEAVSVDVDEGDEFGVGKWAAALGSKYGLPGVIAFTADPNGEAASFHFPGAEGRQEEFLAELQAQGLSGAVVHKKGIGLVSRDEADAAKVHAVAETLGLAYTSQTGHLNADLLGGNYGDG